MKVFIGSSKEQSNLMGKVAFWLEEEGCLPQRWDEPGLFMPGEYIFQSLLLIANSVDAAILIFGDDDETWYRGGIVKKPRDNVLIEYGLFASILGPKRTIVCRVGNTTMPTDLDGIVSVNVSEDKLARARLEFNTWVSRIKYGLEMVGSTHPTPITIKPATEQGASQSVQFVNRDPRLVVASDPSSVPHTSSDFLKERRGGVSMWVELPSFGQGIRHLVNNRYLIAHATNEGKTPYQNVVGLSRGPRIYEPPIEPRWKVLLIDKNGQIFELAEEDTEDIEPGWHHFLLRWNHDAPLLQLLIDGVSKITNNKYIEYWPTEYAETVLFGTWPYRWSEFYLNGKIARTQVHKKWPSDEWLQFELQNKPKNIIST